jgi:hypothetical protein
MSTIHPTQDYMLLSRAGYLVRAAFDVTRGVDAYEMLDPDTGLKVGFASEVEPGAVRRCFRSAFGRNLLLTSVAVYEQASQDLVFTLNELPSLWRPRLVLFDARGAHLCCFAGMFAVIGGGFLVRDRHGRLLGRIEDESEEGRYIFRGRADQALGTIEEFGPLSTGPLSERAAEYLVKRGQTGGHDTAATALLLAAVLALDIVYRERVETAGGSSQRFFRVRRW